MKDYIVRATATDQCICRNNRKSGGRGKKET